MEYVKTVKSNVLKGHPGELEAIVFEKGISNKNVPYTNCVNGTFFSWQADGTYFSTSPLIIDGKTFRWASNHNKPQSCFIIYKDGSVSMKRIINIVELKIDKIKHLFGGVGLINKLDSSFKYDPVLEGFTGSFSDVLRNTNKTVIAYRAKDNQVFLLTTKMHHNDLLKLCNEHNFDIALSLDGGGSTFLKYGDAYKESGDGRKVHNIIRLSEKEIQPVSKGTVIVDIGHLEYDSGVVNGTFREVELNVSIAKYLIADLERHGIKVVVTTGTLANRVKREHEINPLYFISIHNNSGGGDGSEIILYDKKHPQLKLAENILNEITSKGLNNSRGIKENKSLYLLRKTYCPAAIVECAFVDAKDVEVVDTKEERKAFGIAIARGILKTLGIGYIENTRDKDAFITKVEA